MIQGTKATGLILCVLIGFGGWSCSNLFTGGLFDNDMTDDDASDDTNSTDDDASDDTGSTDDDASDDNGTDDMDSMDDQDESDENPEIATFDDPDSDFSSKDVNDVDGEIIRFNSVTQSIVWAVDGSEHQTGYWLVNGNTLGTDEFFVIRFGTDAGERKAYLTETHVNPPTICDVVFQDGQLNIFPSDVLVPQE